MTLDAEALLVAIVLLFIVLSFLMGLIPAKLYETFICQRG